MNNLWSEEGLHHQRLSNNYYILTKLELTYLSGSLSFVLYPKKILQIFFLKKKNKNNNNKNKIKNFFLGLVWAELRSFKVFQAVVKSATYINLKNITIWVRSIAELIKPKLSFVWVGAHLRRLVQKNIMGLFW